jgi:hypothetical protein
VFLNLFSARSATAKRSALVSRRSALSVCACRRGGGVHPEGGAGLCDSVRQLVRVEKIGLSGEGPRVIGADTVADDLGAAHERMAATERLPGGRADLLLR